MELASSPARACSVIFVSLWKLGTGLRRADRVANSLVLDQISTCSGAATKRAELLLSLE